LSPNSLSGMGILPSVESLRGLTGIYYQSIAATLSPVK
jgi:hypothetical protein